MDKWDLRQSAIGYLAWVVSFTGYLVIRTGINVVKFCHYGISAFDFAWPKEHAWNAVTTVFLNEGFWPYVGWIPVALFVDVLIRRYFLRLYV